MVYSNCWARQRGPDCAFDDSYFCSLGLWAVLGWRELIGGGKGGWGGVISDMYTKDSSGF